MKVQIRKGGTKVFTTESGEDRIEAVRSILAESQYAKIDCKAVDLFTASAIVAVYDKLNAENQAKFSAFPIAKMAVIAFQLLKG